MAAAIFAPSTFTSHTQLNSLGLQLSDLCIQLIAPPLQLRQLLRWALFSALWHLQLAGANWISATIGGGGWFCVCVSGLFTHRWFEVRLNPPEPGERRSSETGQEFFFKCCLWTLGILNRTEPSFVAAPQIRHTVLKWNVSVLSLYTSILILMSTHWFCSTAK